MECINLKKLQILKETKIKCMEDCRNAADV